jgi:nucleoside 2-deoxyribosyltransferase
MLEVFVAYAAGNEYHSEIIRKASEAASTADRKILPWAQKDTSGFPIAESVESWIQRADAFVADISSVNDNVTYELGFAIGLAKPVRLIRSEHVNFQLVRDVALLDTLGHDSYGLESTLIKIFRKREENPKWPDIQKNKDQPIFILQPPRPTN